MRILYLSQLVPYPLDAGPKVRSYYVLRYLAEMGHEVTLLALSRESDTAENLDHLRRYCAAVYTLPMVRSRARDIVHLGRSLLTGQPFLIARDHVPAMHKRVCELMATGSFDAVHADQLWMAPYALAARDAALGKPPELVLDQHNAVYLIPGRMAESSSGAARVMLRREARLLKPFEQEICTRFDHVVWVTDEDRAAVDLPAMAGKSSSHVIPICVEPRNSSRAINEGHRYRVTFLGGLHWPPNAAGIVWFARDVWPRVHAACPEAVLTIIGKSPPAELFARQVIGAANGRETDGGSIIITGYVADITSYLDETSVFIVPLHAGGGMRVKILDAWQAGLPVVSTTIGAEGIRYQDGDDLLLADSAEAFADAVIQLVRDKSLAQKISAAGRRKVEECYNWSTIYQEWDAVYPPPAGRRLGNPGNLNERSG